LQPAWGQKRSVHSHCAGHGIHGAGKLDEHAVAGGFNNAAIVLCYRGIDDLATECLQGSQRADLIDAP
jgi:hypothetical protein